MCACVGVCVIYFMLHSLVKGPRGGQRHHELPTLYFSCSVSFTFNLIIIQKQQKHANNQNHKNIFFTINLDLT